MGVLYDYIGTISHHLVHSQPLCLIRGRVVQSENVTLLLAPRWAAGVRGHTPDLLPGSGTPPWALARLCGPLETLEMLMQQHRRAVNALMGLREAGSTRSLISMLMMSTFFMALWLGGYFREWKGKGFSAGEIQLI